MKQVALSEAKAMLKEILAVKHARPETMAAVLALGTGSANNVATVSEFEELDTSIQAIASAAQNVQGGVIVVDDGVWGDLEHIYHDQVVKHVLF